MENQEVITLNKEIDKTNTELKCMKKDMEIMEKKIKTWKTLSIICICVSAVTFILAIAAIAEVAHLVRMVEIGFQALGQAIENIPVQQ